MDAEFKSVNTDIYLANFYKIFLANAHEIIKEAFFRAGEKYYEMVKDSLSTVKIIAINSNGTVDIEGDLNIKFALEYLPDIRSLKGNFICNCNPYVISMEHSPSIVTGDFVCSNNPNLQSLEGSPKFVGGEFYCRYNPLLTSAEGSPETVIGCTSIENYDN